MKILTYEVDGKEKLGVLSKDELWVYPFHAFDIEYSTLLDAVKEMGDSEKQLLEHISVQEPYKVRGAAMIDEVVVKAPIPEPGQDIICLGLNYKEHALESAKFKEETISDAAKEAVYFSKRVNQAVGPGEPIPRHGNIVDTLDYEVELAVVIGKDAYQVEKEDVSSYIFGYTIINDVSARNVQTAHKQWYFGKSLDGFTPMGPCILTRDSIPYPPKLKIQSYVNGELRQDSNTEQMIFNIDDIVSELSRGMTLKAGTIISTGTPAGVGMGFEPPRFLNHGDEVTCMIESIGTITNTVQE